MNGRDEYMVASESVALDAVGFDFLRDIAPGEAVYITFDGELFTRQCALEPSLSPCIFEFVYFARPDSFIDKISVYGARVNMGKKLGAKIRREWDDLDIDVVIPIPETSCDVALEIAQVLDKPYRQGFVKNRYVGRTFIMPGQQLRRKSVRRKLNAIRSEFKDKSVLLVDDSIVRGTTSEQIIEMAREAGAKRVYMASAAPEIRFPNVYGIDMPSANELIAHGREVDEICNIIGADGLIFQDLTDLEEAVREANPDIQQFESSVFSGHYVTKDINQAYLEYLESCVMTMPKRCVSSSKSWQTSRYTTRVDNQHIDKTRPLSRVFLFPIINNLMHKHRAKTHVPHNDSACQNGDEQYQSTGHNRAGVNKALFFGNMHQNRHAGIQQVD